jgi:predicted Zn-dependent protease
LATTRAFVDNAGMESAAEPTGTLEVALQHAGQLLASNPALALEQAREILKAAPNHPVATLILGRAQRLTGNLDEALRTLKALTDAQHRWAAAHFELGQSLGEAGECAAGITALRRAVELKPDLPHAWRALGDLLTVQGDARGADQAYARQLKISTSDPRLQSAAAALLENQIPEAERLLRLHLLQFPTDVAALRMLAEVAARLGRLADAEQLLVRCLELAPSFDGARHNYALILYRRDRPADALQELQRLLKSEPRNPAYLNSLAVVLARIGDYRESIETYAQVLARNPNNAKIWLSYGHALGAAGREQDAIAAYRRSIAVAPNLGEAYWSLANLKTLRFSAGELQAMRSRLERTDLSDEDRFHFHFALGKALEDAGDYASSFEHYAEGNRLRRAGIFYDPGETDTLVQRSKTLFSREFFAQRSGFGTPAADPIFVVGLPRSGSTLIEQILASHSQVEGTMELQNVINMSRELSGRKFYDEPSQYPQALAALSAAQCRELGERYLAETQIQRKTGRPFFIDKMPNNWMHVGFIHLILPNARIVDARRHPMACCFSGYKQHFARGQHFTYSLEEIGRYYRSYVELMAHMERVLPGKIHRVHYERMIEDTETEVRTLLSFCGLPFEESCLRYYETERAVRTASAYQVRKPIFREGLEQWRHYEPWLEPLRTALGPVLAAYPAAPDV